MSCQCADCRDADGNVTDDTPRIFKAKILGAVDHPWPVPPCENCAGYANVEWILTRVDHITCIWHGMEDNPCGGREMWLFLDGADSYVVFHQSPGHGTVRVNLSASSFDCNGTNTFAADREVGGSPTCDFDNVSIEVTKIK